MKKLLCYRLVVAIENTPVEFPKGKPINSNVRLSTAGNSSSVYIAPSAIDSQTASNRFVIAKNKNIPLKISNFDGLFLNADSASDALNIFAELKEEK